MLHAYYILDVVPSKVILRLMNEWFESENCIKMLDVELSLVCGWNKSSSKQITWTMKVFKTVFKIESISSDCIHVCAGSGEIIMRPSLRLCPVRCISTSPHRHHTCGDFHTTVTTMERIHTVLTREIIMGEGNRVESVTLLTFTGEPMPPCSLLQVSPALMLTFTPHPLVDTIFNWPAAC